MTSTAARLALVALLLAATAGCVNNIEGAVGVTRAPNGHLALAVVWCDRPSTMGAWILKQNPWKAVVEYKNPEVDSVSDFQILDIDSPEAPWQLSSGLAKLYPDVDYTAEAWPGDGKNGIFGQVGFRLKDVEKLKTGQVWLGTPGHVVTWNYFLEYAEKDACS
ncbi:hypothetical protein [Microtetraspora malaysiensis]|uniref:hypothetical protein n=1 Tax=Microtetraspora malaysiensis TaxID=161358 RepID=UPI0012FCDF24|nr:hypothetical protein [Microtetraspora malaysiensis]